MTMLSTTASAVRLTVRVQPRASRDRVAGRHGEALKVQVTAPPIDDAANQRVVDLIARWLGVPRRAVRIAHGESARDKVIEVASADPAELAERIQRLLDGCVDKAEAQD